MTMEGTLIACNMLGFSLGSPGPSTGLGRMNAQKMAAPTRTAVTIKHIPDLGLHKLLKLSRAVERCKFI
jgi:hypothetical protein